MSTGSSSTDSAESDPAEFMTSPRRRDLILAHLVFDVDGHSIATKNRLHTAAHFILQDAFDNPYCCFLDEDDPRMEDLLVGLYLKQGDENRRKFMGAKLMALNMVRLEDAAIRSYHAGDYVKLSNEVLNSIIEEQLREKERVNLETKEPLYPKGTGLSDDMIIPVWKTRVYESKPENSINGSADCRICFDRFINETYVAGSKYCKHEYHINCLLEWLHDHRLCPLCNSVILPPEVEYPTWIKDLDKVRDFLNRDY